MKKILRNALGVGMIEIFIGFALIGTASYLVLNGMDFLNNKKSEADKTASIEYMISGLVESIRANINMEKIDFQAEEKFLNKYNLDEVKASLKMCWVNDGILPGESYPDCPGKIGYVITPLKTGPLELRGLYKVTVRLTHDQLYPGRFKQYEFIVKDP